eukprot:SAG22_NODE_5306_length_1040_cov_5.952179_1_plen_85_part_10
MQALGPLGFYFAQTYVHPKPLQLLSSCSLLLRRGQQGHDLISLAGERAAKLPGPTVCASAGRPRGGGGGGAGGGGGGGGAPPARG